MGTTTFVVGDAPGALPVVGHLHHVLRDPLRFVASLAAHGDLVRVRLGTRDAYVVCDPELTHRVLVDDKTFDKGGPYFEKFKELVGEGLGTSGHAAHRRQRQLVQPSFSRRRLAEYAEVMADQIAAMLDTWRHGQRIDLVTQLYDLALNITIRTMFSARMDDATATRFRLDLLLFLEDGFKSKLLPPFVEKLPLPRNRRVGAAATRLRATVNQVIAGCHRSDTDDASMLSALVTARDEQGAALPARELFDHVMTMFFGGLEPPATLTSWAVYLLRQHPEVRQRLEVETDEALHGRTARLADLPALPLTRRVLMETLRLYPAGWLLTRTTTAATTLAGKPMPAGTTVIYSPYLLHHSPGLYTEPERFDPDRWLWHDAEQPPNGAYLPFGMGARRCVGEAFALNQAMLTLASITARWRVEPVPGTLVRPHVGLTISPKSLPALTMRRPSPSTTS